MQEGVPVVVRDNRAHPPGAHVQTTEPHQRTLGKDSFTLNAANIASDMALIKLLTFLNKTTPKHSKNGLRPQI